MRCYCVMEHGRPLVAVDRPVPEPNGSEVLVKVLAAGLCHTDLHLWEGHYDLGGGKKLTLAERGIKPPITLSHEVAGEVVAGPAAAAAGLAAGQRVLVHPWIGCGECAACRRGEEHICIKPGAIGIVRPGGFAEYVLVPSARYLVPIDGLDPATAAPLACAGVTTYSALKKFGRRIHEGPVVVIGAGGLGLMAIRVLAALGGQGAIVVDVDAGKRGAALAAGALVAIDARAADAAQQLVAATGGGARAVLDLVGATPTVTLAMAACARGGHIVICGLMGGDITVSLPVIPMRPLTLQGSYVGTVEELRELVALAKQGSLASIPVTCRPLAQANEALADLHAGKVVGRTILVP
ncbi:MAG: alcohol dehydrogenase catalytic domain-containing protein [Rubrivivax sp.]|nr:alcohol dehydrogenase catalytic domain-containing protein [Rubrivivax sp.]